MAITSTIFNSIRKFDAYPKTLEDFRIKTYSGAIVTILSGILMTILFISELSYYLTPEIKEDIFVDLSRGNKLRINLDVVMPRIPCSLISIDSLDVSGVQQINLAHNIFKRRLDLDGYGLDSVQPEKETKLGVPTEETQVAVKNETKCGSCYSAETEEQPCCQTCEDIQVAYRKKGWAFKKAEDYEQCISEGWKENVKQTLTEGCHVYGYVEVNRVAGNFHIAPGVSYQQHHVHVHDLQPYSASEFNITHRINHLSFGSRSSKTGPLDNLYVVAEKGAMMFQYYAKIVPSTYVTIDNNIKDTTQFSVTRHSKVSSTSGADQVMPGVFIIYELSPMMVRYTETRKSFLHFLTGVCGIIGGIFTVAGLIDAVIYHSSNIIRKKIELGKGY
ncbi:Endoplasmic reticulum-Golgi intermediate compartment protein 3 [Chamberlinius hualienensis]